MKVLVPFLCGLAFSLSLPAHDDTAIETDLDEWWDENIDLAISNPDQFSAEFGKKLSDYIDSQNPFKDLGAASGTASVQRSVSASTSPVTQLQASSPTTKKKAKVAQQSSQQSPQQGIVQGGSNVAVISGNTASGSNSISCINGQCVASKS